MHWNRPACDGRTGTPGDIALGDEFERPIEWGPPWEEDVAEARYETWDEATWGTVWGSCGKTPSPPGTNNTRGDRRAGHPGSAYPMDDPSTGHTYDDDLGLPRNEDLNRMVLPKIHLAATWTNNAGNRCAVVRPYRAEWPGNRQAPSAPCKRPGGLRPFIPI